MNTMIVIWSRSGLSAGLGHGFGGNLMSIDLHLIVFVSIASCCLAIGLIALLWRDNVMTQLDPR